MFGGLHIEIAALKTLGDWLRGSGWVRALVQAEIAKSGTAPSCELPTSPAHKCSLFCSLLFCIVMFECACLMVQSIVCDHGRFNATPFIKSFQLKYSWKLSNLTKFAQIGCKRTVPTPRVFSLGRYVSDPGMSSWQIIHSFQLV